MVNIAESSIIVKKIGREHFSDEHFPLVSFIFTRTKTGFKSRTLGFFILDILDFSSYIIQPRGNILTRREAS